MLRMKLILDLLRFTWLIISFCQLLPVYMTQNARLELKIFCINELPQDNSPQCFYGEVCIWWSDNFPLVHVNDELQHVYHAPEILQGNAYKILIVVLEDKIVFTSTFIFINIFCFLRHLQRKLTLHLNLTDIN